MMAIFRTLTVVLSVCWAWGFSLSGGWAQHSPIEEPPPSQAAQAIYNEALSLMHQNKIDEALAKLSSVPTAEAGHSIILNLKGAMLVRKKDFTAAAAVFNNILEKIPNHSLALFNLGEVYFLQKNYPKSKEFFTRFLKEPGNSQNALGRYKVFLCDLLGADTAAAAQTLKSLEPTISHPFYYYANAAVAFKAGRDTNAREFIQSAFAIYPGHLNAAFTDSMVEIGWLKSEEIAHIGRVDPTALQNFSNEFRPEASTLEANPGFMPEGMGFENVLPDFAREKKPTPSAQPNR